ncbi:MAG: hypothetical protein WA775_08135 [Psychroserpens sp.]|uniref:tetratricopeptide repeat protein n=1 Tax=Psychroserpens sp. TaxID=2020870 RepID=UPI003C8E84B2
MKHLTIIAVLLVSMIATAQTDFEKGMAKAFDLWEQDKMDEAENMFERISNAEPDQWLPHYYIAQINSLKSWSEKDINILKVQLEKAQEHINTAMAIRKDNPEILVLQAQVLTNWVAFDGMTYGMKYSGKIAELYANAQALAPKNPRAAFGKAEWEMQSAKYFGKDTKPYCEAIENSIELFTNFKPESEFHPKWGKERAKQTLESCKG